MVNHVTYLGFCINSDGAQTLELHQDEIFVDGSQLPNSSHCAVEVRPGFVLVSGNAYYGHEKAAFGIDPETTDQVRTRSRFL